MKTEYKQPGIIHLRYETQEEVACAFARLQEFYESPDPLIRGQVFSLETLKASYTNDGEDNWTYCEDWNGFNVPGEVVLSFFTRFTDLSPAEEQITMAVIRSPFHYQRFYLIGTWQEADEEHEMAHALFSLDDEYRSKVQNIVVELHMTNTSVATLLYDTLIDWGYDDSVMVDEFNAYLATTPRGWWVNEYLLEDQDDLLWTAGAPFRALFQEHTSHDLPTPAPALS